MSNDKAPADILRKSMEDQMQFHGEQIGKLMAELVVSEGFLREERAQNDVLLIRLGELVAELAAVRRDMKLQVEALGEALQNNSEWAKKMRHSYEEEISALKKSAYASLRAEIEAAKKWGADNRDLWIKAEKERDSARALLAARDARVVELEGALEGIATGYGGAGGDDEGESFEETVAAMRKDADDVLNSPAPSAAPEPKEEL